MIPWLDSFGKQRKDGNGVPMWQSTKADTELKGCDAITIPFCGRRYPLWKFIEQNYWLKDKENHLIPFRLNDAQIFMLKTMDAQYRKTGMVRLNCGKARQLGSSTVIIAIYLTLMLTRPGFTVGILADTEDKGNSLLSKYKSFFMTLPPEVQDEFPIKDNSTGKFSIDFGNGMVSSVEVIVANEKAGASKTFQALHCSEVALWLNIKDTIPVLEATVYEGYDTYIIRETTARGMNWWKNLYEAGKSRKGAFWSIFLAWWLESGYSAKYDGHELSKEERKLRDAGIPLDKIQWWRRKLESFAGDIRKMKEEFPSTESEMWQTTASTKFDMAIVHRRKSEVDGVWIRRGVFEFEDPVTDGTVDGVITLSDPRWREDATLGTVTIFEEPRAGHPYAISCDPANGGEDYYAAVVVDCSNDRQVATYHEQKVDYDQAAWQCYCLWLYYSNMGISDDGSVKAKQTNRCFVTGERNTTRGWLRYMKRLGAEPIRVDRSDDEKGAFKNELGYSTQASNRNAMIDESVAVFRANNGMNILDYETLCEMETFETYARGGATPKPQALPGHHDDLILAYAGYLHCKADFECNIESVNAKTSGVPSGFDPFDTSEENERASFMDW